MPAALEIFLASGDCGSHSSTSSQKGKVFKAKESRFRYERLRDQTFFLVVGVCGFAGTHDIAPLK